MKDFFKYVFATVVGIIVVGLIWTITMVVSIIGMASAGSSVPVPKDGVLVINLDGTIDERAQDNPLAGLFGNSVLPSSTGLDQMLRAIRNAKENDDIKGIYIEAGALSGVTPATLQEIRQALVDFKTATKTHRVLITCAPLPTPSSSIPTAYSTGRVWPCSRSITKTCSTRLA